MQQDATAKELTANSLAPIESAAQELDALADRIGNFIHHWGFKKVHGRIWTHLYLSQAPLDAAALIRKLKVSKALVSMSLKELLKLGVVRELGRGNEGTRLYEANPDVTTIVLAVLRNREKKIIDRIQSSFSVLDEMPESTRASLGMSVERFRLLSGLIQVGKGTLDGLLSLSPGEMENWKRTQTGA